MSIGMQDWQIDIAVWDFAHSALQSRYIRKSNHTFSFSLQSRAFVFEQTISSSEKTSVVVTACQRWSHVPVLLQLFESELLHAAVINNCQSCCNLPCVLEHFYKKEHSSKRVTKVWRCVFLKMSFHPCVSGCGRFLAPSDSHDHFKQADSAFMDIMESCSHCGKMAIAVLRSRLQYLKRGGVPFAMPWSSSSSSKDEQHCGHRVHQPSWWSMFRLHVATCPSSPPLE